MPQIKQSNRVSIVKKKTLNYIYNYIIIKTYKIHKHLTDHSLNTVAFMLYI